jgi:rhodanese-related sulfurtransferase
VYCQSGNRSRMASKIMADLGFERVYDLKGGYANWGL